VVMRATWGPYVHSEIFVQKGADVRFYSASSPRGKGLIPSTRLSNGLPTDTGMWQVVRFPFVKQGGYEAAYALILQILAMQLPYNYHDLWQCGVKIMLPFEDDLDCDNLETWRNSGVFCSQVCLLILRRLARKGIIGPLHPSTTQRWEAPNSRGCSPNALYNLLIQPLLPEKKCETMRACGFSGRRLLSTTNHANRPCS
jgi:hypothetical protein